MKKLQRVALALAMLLVVAACAGTTDTTDAPAATDAPVATDAPAATDAPVATEPMAEFVGNALVAGCDYGGKIDSVTALDAYTVEFALCGPDPAFLAKAAFTPFGIQPEEHILATGGAPLDNPIGTGPFVFSEWNRGDSIVYTANQDYYGQVPAFNTLVYRWATEGAQRLLELQSGEVDMIANPSPDDLATIAADPNLNLIDIPAQNVLYIGMTNTFAPFDDVAVRQAIAKGIDRARLVDNFYPAGSEVASHFTPCAIENGCAGEAWYDFDAQTAIDELAAAGFPEGFSTTIYYRDVFRSYLPDPSLVATDLQAQLADIGITAEIIVMESGEFIDESTSGRLDGIHLLGWGADYPHVTNFLDFHFAEANPQFGDPHPAVFEALITASGIGDPAEAAPYYETANNAIKELVPMIPVVHGAAAAAAASYVDGAHYPPYGAPQFEFMNPGKDTLVYMQNAEPISFYCADETDGESLSVCQQVVEPLFTYKTDSGETVPRLATECVPNEDTSLWTCSLREGVVFHDGSTFDANDVVASWAVGLDAANPLHVGNTGGFDYFAYLWDGLINADG